jgi:hypothetical protein
MEVEDAILDPTCTQRLDGQLFWCGRATRGPTRCREAEPGLHLHLLGAAHYSLASPVSRATYLPEELL